MRGSGTAAAAAVSGCTLRPCTQDSGREDSGEGKKLAKGGEHGRSPDDSVGGGTVSNRSLDLPLTLTGVGYHSVTRAFARFERARDYPQTLAELVQTARGPFLVQVVWILPSFTDCVLVLVRPVVDLMLQLLERLLGGIGLLEGTRLGGGNRAASGLDRLRGDRIGGNRRKRGTGNQEFL